MDSVSDPLGEVASEIKKELTRFTANVRKPNVESQWRLGELARELISLGASVEKVASLAGVHALAIRSWLKNQTKPAAEELKESTLEAGVPPDEKAMAALPPANKEVLPPPKPTPDGLLKIDHTGSLKSSSADDNWVRIGVSGHMMEIDWRDLLDNLPGTDAGPAAREVPLTKAC
ncbi:MAG TPA: hypothetical protein VE954_33535 [Oligoflexus sp.]|uniref:hypothetical protein n=1 Tax=Oligoflexus sp. TaxID=1971216 RepID=UPI002D2B23F5|nr:hypothetical protein [Oligoflexus sp.]HYX38051.1 hypothetical protein [Oligoflexus sp.]